ncbi:SDR family NAD(P)-dependent oxidoreductase [Novosphingobium malaysiense]|uniref:Oxidoreductase n=1 Tax=Novosphingobium malaysiense TaxID=1348853 RepID=A0A0B1ZM63_9SPHN|nr:SDR family oxidoreductase [Novosphingobium malaysiense]KHK90288.1 oxidoreductase [Novosphingobium malaysiense]
MTAETLLDLTGRTIIVAGAGGGGMGTILTRLVASAGATVIAVDNSRASLEEHVQSLRSEGLSIVPVQADIGTEQGVEEIMVRALAEPDDLFGLVTIVGGVPDAYWGAATEVTREGWQWLFAYNLDSMFFLTQAVARELRARRLPGSLVSIASISGLTATPFHIGYGAAKAAVLSVVKTMALELAADNIRVNSVAPGAIATPTAGLGPDKERDRWAVPMARQGRAEEVASSVLYLLSDMAGYMTGQCLVVDGGVSVKWSHLDAENCPAYARDRSFLDRWRRE